jgi:hypothetical protein
MKRFALLAVVLLLAGCASPGNPLEGSFSPASFKVTYPPVASSRLINVGHVDPMGVYQRDFAEKTLVGTAAYITESPQPADAEAFARKAGADLVLWRRSFESSRSELDYQMIHGSDTTSTTVKSSGGTEVRATTDSGWTYVPTTRNITLYRVDAVLLRTEQAIDAPAAPTP